MFPIQHGTDATIIGQNRHQIMKTLFGNLKVMQHTGTIDVIELFRYGRGKLANRCIHIGNIGQPTCFGAGTRHLAART